MNLNDADAAKVALERALTSGQRVTIADTAMANFWPLFSFHYTLLLTAVERVPPDVLERYPMLCAIRPMTQVLARTNRPFKPLIDPDTARAMSPDELDILILAQVLSFRFSGDIAASLVYARRLAERVANVDTDAHRRADGPLWYIHLEIGSTYLLSGDSSRALLEFASARDFGRLSPQPDAERCALGRIALAHAVRGSLTDAQAALDEAMTKPEGTPAHESSMRTTEATAAALIAVERMNANVEDLVAGLEPYHSTELTWSLAMLARTRALIAQHRPGEALEAIRLARDAHPPQYGSITQDIISSQLIDALIERGDETAARQIADRRQGSGPMTALAAVSLDLYEGRLDQAARALRQVEGHLRSGPLLQTKHLLLSAWLELSRKGRVGVQTALAIARSAATGDCLRLLSAMPNQLIDAVHAQLDGAATAEFAASVRGLDFRDVRNRSALTESERRVLNALPEYVTIADVAAALHVSPNTIKSQLKSLYRKLGCSSRDEAIEIGARFVTVADAHAGRDLL